eukprot:909009_1
MKHHNIPCAHPKTENWSASLPGTIGENLLMADGTMQSRLYHKVKPTDETIEKATKLYRKAKPIGEFTLPRLLAIAIPVFVIGVSYLYYISVGETCALDELFVRDSEGHREWEEMKSVVFLEEQPDLDVPVGFRAIQFCGEEMCPEDMQLKREEVEKFSPVSRPRRKAGVVMYIPGNAAFYPGLYGLFREVQRNFEADDSELLEDLDLFFIVVDFNMTWSVSSGETLWQCMGFAAYAIDYALATLSGPMNYEIQSVIITGHSMGTFLTSSIVGRYPSIAQNVSAIFLLSSLIRNPAIDIDYLMSNQYYSLHQIWREQPSHLDHLAVANFHAGNLDRYAETILGHPSGFFADRVHESIVTRSIPEVSQSMEHEDIHRCVKMVSLMGDIFMDLLKYDALPSSVSVGGTEKREGRLEIIRQYTGRSSRNFLRRILAGRDIPEKMNFDVQKVPESSDFKEYQIQSGESLSFDSDDAKFVMLLIDSEEFSLTSFVTATGEFVDYDDSYFIQEKMFTDVNCTCLPEYDCSTEWKCEMWSLVHVSPSEVQKSLTLDCESSAGCVVQFRRFTDNMNIEELNDVGIFFASVDKVRFVDKTFEVDAELSVGSTYPSSYFFKRPGKTCFPLGGGRAHSLSDRE